MSIGLVYVVDDEKTMRHATAQSLTLADYDVVTFSSAEEALSCLEPNWPGIVVTDLRMPNMDGLEFLDAVIELDAELPVILISGHADIATAVKAIQDGAYDFIEKPFDPSQLVNIVSRALKHRSVLTDNRRLRAELQQQQSDVKLIGKSEIMRNLNQNLVHIAGTDTDVLILGETGTGKELAATTVHQFSDRKNKNFVAINCGALPDTLIESELFGHTKGAFTGANKDHIGKLEYANHGTFFLDEIESMPVSMQVKLLRVLQERKLQRIGSNDEIDLNIRIIAASKIDLREAADKGTFREDLYYRLDVVKLTIPPLRERKEDIPLLFEHFYKKACERMNKECELLDSAFILQLLEHDWPGNVRELQHSAERAAIGLGADLNSSESHNSNGPNHTLSERMDAYEKLNIERELLKNTGSITHTYKALGVSRKTLYDKMKKHGLSRHDCSSDDNKS